MNRREKLALSTSTLLAALLIGLSASAAGVSVLEASSAQLNDAKVPYLDGVKYMNSKHYKEAVEKFRESYDIVASPNSRLMLGRALVKVNQPLDAYREFEATMQQASELGVKQPKYQKTAEAARKELDDIKVELAFITVIPGTEVSIGGRKLADGDWGKPLPVLPGKVPVEITATDGRVRKKRLRLEPGTTRVLSADLTSAAIGGAADAKDDGERDQKAEESSRGSSGSSGGLNRKTVGFIAGGIGVAGIAGFIGTTIAANSIYGDDLKAKCNKGGANYCSRAAVDNAEGKGRYEGFGYASLGVGIVGLGVGAYLLLTENWSSGSSSASAEASTSLQIGPRSVALRRTF
jgi:tetratricopeptide (TPR) repeat protein